MKVLVTGKGGKAGSWKIRGEQLGAAIGAHVQPMAGLDDCRDADLVVVVKRTPPGLIHNIRKSRRPWVLDIVDGWPQPSNLSRDAAVAWLHQTIRTLKPTAVVFGTTQMQADAEFEGPSVVLPHHSWQRYVDQQPTMRETVRVVGYEGSPRYLGKWLGVLQAACERRGWEFQINGDMGDADVGIALRDGGGYPAQYWKPGTKLSNLHALGIPALCSVELGYRSVASGAEFWIESEAGIDRAFDELADTTRRLQIGDQMRTAALPLNEVAAQYSAWLTTLL